MLWITKYRHNKIVEEYKEVIADLREALNRKDLLTKIVEKLADKVTDGTFLSASSMGWVSASGELILPDDVPR